MPRAKRVMVNVDPPADFDPAATIPDPPAPAPVPPAPSPVPPPVPQRPVPEELLSADQKRIRDLEDQLARERGRKDPEPQFNPTPAADGDIVLHFLADGLTAFGKVWYRGEVMRLTPADYLETCDRHGRSWVDLRGDDFAQVERWGHVKFREGPWPGKPLTEVAKASFDVNVPFQRGERLKPSEEELARIEAAVAKRNGAIPRVPVS